MVLVLKTVVLLLKYMPLIKDFLNIIFEHSTSEFNQMYWEKMISIENKSRINFEFELRVNWGK